ncbi:MAG: MBOAT family protein [Firmicutes bacterium]|nr:MBOAT family protein [Bacillota bacterium]
MVFSSFHFLLIFLPLFLAAYYICPKRFRNACMLLFSMAFYAYGAWKTPLYILLFAASMLANYAFGLLTESAEGKKKKLFLTAGLCLDLGILVFFKYSWFLRLMPFKLVLPIGISFYTFQSMSYLIDVYRGDAKAEKDPIDLCAYISMFPQLIAGPIVRYTEISAQLKDREYTLESFVSGVRLFILGLGAKVVLANQIGGLWRDVKTIGVESVTTPMAWLGLIAYSFQLYFDFCGYSLMAIGLGRMAGFELPRNFDSPYVSVSMTEFWRRWHITLGAWFREYLYIPLGGSRRSKARNTLNLFIVWVLTGLWHGAGWNFLLWGVFLFLCMAAERAFLLKRLEKHRLAGHLYMTLLIPLSWMIFATDSLPELAAYAQRLIGAGGLSVYAKDWSEALGTYAKLLIPAAVLCTEWPARLYRRYEKHPAVCVLLAALLAASVYCLYAGMNDPFLYFRF